MFLSVFIRIERIHQYEWYIDAILSVQLLDLLNRQIKKVQPGTNGFLGLGLSKFFFSIDENALDLSFSLYQNHVKNFNYSKLKFSTLLSLFRFSYQFLFFL